MKRVALFFFLLLLFHFGAYATTWTITSANNSFLPDYLIITAGDTIIFQLDGSNNAQEVSQTTWSNNDSTPVIGFKTKAGTDTVTGLSQGVHYYVSDSGAAVGMKGRIVVYPPATVSFLVLKDTVAESAGIVPVAIQVNNPSTALAEFSVARDDQASSAKIVTDYSFTNQTLQNGQGATYDTVYINIVDEQLIEPTETVVLRLHSLLNNTLITTDSFTLYIENDDTLSVSFLGAGFSYQESADSAYIPVIISSPVPYPVSVTVKLDSGNAVKGVNFECADSAIITFPANSTDTLHFGVKIFEDTLSNGNLQANFNLLNPTAGARLGISAYTLFIIDDDFTNGISEYNEIPIYIFPNPVSGLLNINMKGNCNHAWVTDLLGNKIPGLEALHTGLNQINASNLTPGMYFIVTGTFALRFIKE